MTSLASISDLVNRATGGNSGAPENLFYSKLPQVAGTGDTWVAGLLVSMWRYDGYPCGGAAPGAVAVPTNSTAGALPITNPSGGREKWLTAGVVGASTADMSMLFLYDRLLHISGLSGTSTSTQNVQSGSGVALTRNTGGVGNQIWVEVYTQVGTTARTLTVTYTNSAGTGGKTTTITLGGTAATQFNKAFTIVQVPLASGDVGVQSVESCILSASTGTAGDFGITIAKPISTLSRGRVNSFIHGMPGLPNIPTNACLAVIGMSMTSTKSTIHGMFGFVES